MSVPIPLRVDFDASRVRGLAKKTKDGPQARRLLALAAIYDGATRSEAAKIGGVGLQIIRDWVMRFNARGPDGLLDGKSPGQPSKLNDVQRRAVARMIESGPIPAAHGVVRWRLIDLAQWIYEEFCITIAKQTLSGNCGPWAIASCRRGYATTPRPRARSRILKKLPRAQDHVHRIATVGARVLIRKSWYKSAAPRFGGFALWGGGAQPAAAL
jgi:transposase